LTQKDQTVRGIANSSVTASFFGATLTSLILSRIVEQPPAKAKLLTIMLL